MTELASIIASLRTDNPAVEILIAEIIPGQTLDTASLNAAIRNWAPAMSTTLSPVTVVDHYTGYDATTDNYDNFHPNAIGEEKMATRWFETLQNILEPETSQFAGDVLVVNDPTQGGTDKVCLLYTSPSPRDKRQSRMPSSA